MGAHVTGQSFLRYATILGMHDYIDWETGNVYFDNGDFLELLEFAKSLPSSMLYSGSDFEFIASGRQIMQISENIYSFEPFNDFQIIRSVFGGDIVFKGLPTRSGSGNMMLIDNGLGLAITSSSASVEGAWAFLRTILSSEWQRANIFHSFPSNKTIFDERLSRAMESSDSPRVMTWNDKRIEYSEVTEEDANQLFDVFDSLTGSSSTDVIIMNIIHETANDYFNGRHSSEDAVRIIQNRISIYVSELVG